MLTSKISTLAASALLAVAAASSAAANCSVVVMDRILPYKVSSGTDNDVNQAIFGMVSDYYAALSEASTNAASATDNPKAKAILTAAGAGAGGFSAIAAKLPGLIGSIDSSRDDADDLYMSLSPVRGQEGAFFPEIDDWTSAFTPGLQASLNGITGRVVPYIFGIDPRMDRIEVNLFDHDNLSRDDTLGQAVFFKNQAGTGKTSTVAMTEKHGGVVYIIQYEVVPFTCPAGAEIMLKPIYQTMNVTNRDTMPLIYGMTRGFLNNVPTLQAMGISF